MAVNINKKNTKPNIVKRISLNKVLAVKNKQEIMNLSKRSTKKYI